jgi:hypothetical protein
MLLDSCVPYVYSAVFALQHHGVINILPATRKSANQVIHAEYITYRLLVLVIILRVLNL